MLKRSAAPAARLRRALLVLPVIGVSQQLLANTGVQLPLSQYAGNETTTLVPNGNFSDRGTVDGNGNYPQPTGWSGFGDIYAGPPALTDPAYATQINPYSAVVRPAVSPGDTIANSGFTQNYGSPASLTPNANYVLSAYIWNDGIHDFSSLGEGDLVTVKIVDPDFATFNNISITLEGQGADLQDGGTGRFAYLMFNESQVRHWSTIEVQALADKGIVMGARPEAWAQFDNISITPIETFLGQKFTGTSGNWNDSTKWAGGVAPNVKGAIASFTTAAAPTTVTVNAATTVGAVMLGGAGGYTIDGGSTLRLQVTEDGFHQFQGVPTVHVLSGNHTITAPLVFDATSDGTSSNPHNSPFLGAFNVATGSSVTATDVTATGVDMTKYGDGTATVDKMRSKSLNVAAGTLRVAPNSTASGVSTMETLTVASGAKFDLSDNKLITNDAVGTASGGTYDGVQGLVQAAYNSGAWNGSGITTSMPDAATGLTSIGVGNAGQVLAIPAGGTDTFAGQTVTDTNTLVMYTYRGDANLDGFISGDDYSAIDFAAGTPGASGWTNGDFNYDGVISGDDYSAIDFNLVAQGDPFPTAGAAGAAGITAVPEPTWLGAGTIALLALRRRARHAE